MAAPALPDGYTLVALDDTDSTNDRAKARANEGAPDGTVVWARTQRAGRGRRGRSWISPSGNLYLSIVARPGVPAARAPELSFVAALAAADVIDGALPGRARCKWPNDILADGRKVAGILLESSLEADRGIDWVVLGVGVNLAHHPGLGAPRPSTSLAAEGAEPPAPAAALERCVAAFAAWRARWLAEGFGPIRAGWLARAHGLGETVTVQVGARRRIGTFDGLDDTGALILTEPDGTRHAVTAGEVFHGDARTADAARD